MTHLEDVVCTLESFVSELRGIKSAATSLDSIQAELADLNQHVGKIAASLERLANSAGKEERPTAGVIKATAKPAKRKAQRKLSPKGRARIAAAAKAGWAAQKKAAAKPAKKAPAKKATDKAVKPVEPGTSQQ